MVIFLIVACLSLFTIVPSLPSSLPGASCLVTLASGNSKTDECSSRPKSIMMLYIRQTYTLITKNLLLAVVRRPTATAIRALVFPIILVLVLSYAQFFLNPRQTFGVGTSSPVLSLSEALPLTSPSRDTVAFVHNGLLGGSISAVIEALAAPYGKAGKTVRLLSSERELAGVCVSSPRAASNCVGAVVFHSSIDEPAASGVWNYTIRTDSSLGLLYDVTSTTNDAQLYLLPLQLAIDQAIAENSPRAKRDALQKVEQMLYTPEPEKKRVRDTQMSYLKGLIDRFGVVFFFALVPVVYHSVGVMAAEREIGASQLVEAMMPNRARWTTQFIRLLAHHLSFDIIYGGGWLAMAIVLSTVVLLRTSPVIVILYHLLAGLSLSSFSLFGAAFFQKSQLSSIVVTLVVTILAIVPQVLPDINETRSIVTALIVIFPSSNYYYFLTQLARWEYEGHPTDLLKVPPRNPWQISGITFFACLGVQIVIYPVLAVLVEQILYGTSSDGRKILSPADAGADADITVRLQDFKKT